MANDLRPPGAGAIIEAVTPRFGLCDHCVHQRIVRSGRGSVFSMCGRHKTDPAFPKYPRMPVLRCPGFEPAQEPPPGGTP